MQREFELKKVDGGLGQRERWRGRIEHYVIEILQADESGPVVVEVLDGGEIAASLPWVPRAEARKTALDLLDRYKKHREYLEASIVGF